MKRHGQAPFRGGWSGGASCVWRETPLWPDRRSGPSHGSNIARAGTQHPRFRQMLSLGRHSGSLEGAGSSDRLGIDRRTERLVRHVGSPRPHPRRGFSPREHHALQLVNDQDQLRVIGGDETLLVAFPERHNGCRSFCRWSLKQRPTMATTEEDCEQTDCSNAWPSVGNMRVLLSSWGGMRREAEYRKLVSRLIEAGNTGNSYCLQVRQQAKRCTDADAALRLSGWNVDFTFILVFWISQEDQGGHANWRGGATMSSANRQDVRRRQIRRLREATSPCPWHSPSSSHPSSQSGPPASAFLSRPSLSTCLSL